MRTWSGFTACCPKLTFAPSATGQFRPWTFIGDMSASRLEANSGQSATGPEAVRQQSAAFSAIDLATAAAQKRTLARWGTSAPCATTGHWCLSGKPTFAAITATRPLKVGRAPRRPATACSGRRDQAHSRKNERRNHILAVQLGHMPDEPLHEVGARLQRGEMADRRHVGVFDRVACPIAAGRN